MTACARVDNKLFAVTMTTTEGLDEDDQPTFFYFISMPAAQSLFLFLYNIYHQLLLAQSHLTSEMSPKTLTLASFIAAHGVV